MASRHDIIHIDFQANAGKANVALQALQSEAEKARLKVEGLRQQLQNAKATNMPIADIQKLENELKMASKESKQWQTALQNNMKGVRALDEAIKAFNKGKGTVEDMNAALSKTALNAAQLQKSRSADGSKTWKEMDALIVALQQNIAKCNTAMNSLVATIKNGGTASKNTLMQAKTDLQQMIALEEQGSKGWVKYTSQLKTVEGELNRLTAIEQQVAGKNALTQVFRGDYITKSNAEIEKLIAKIKEYQASIQDPEGKGARHFRATETALQKLQAQLDKTKISVTGVQQALKAAGAAGMANRFGGGLEAQGHKIAQAYRKTTEALNQLQQKRQTYTNIQQNGLSLTAQEQAMLAKLDTQIAATTARQEKLRAELIKVGEAQNLSTQQISQSITLLRQQQEVVAAGSPAWKKYEAAINSLDERMKIMRGEAMSLFDAMRLSTKAGGQGFTGTAKQLQLAQQAIEKAAAAAKKGSPEWQKYQQALAKVRVEMNNASMTSERMRTVIAQPANAKNLNELSAAVKRAKAELDLMAGTVGKTSKAYTDLAAQTKKAEIQMKQMQAQSHGTASAWDKAVSRLKTYIGLYVGAAVAMQKIVATMGDIMDLSDKMGEVRKTTGFTADEVGRLSDNLKKMDVRTPLVELMEVSAAAGQLGLKTIEDVQGFTEAANKLMIAMPEMGKEAATQMMRVAIATGEVEKIRKQMQEGLIEGSSATAVAMEKIASTIDRLRASSASTAPEITDFVKRLGAVGAQSGITIDQVAALGSTVSSLGMRVEMSATALSRMIPAIKNNAFAVAKAIGVTPDTLRSLFDAGRGMEAILMIFQHIRDAGMDEDSIEKMLGMHGMQEVMKELNQMGARAGIVFAGLSQNVDELRRQLGVADQAYEENIAIQQEFEKMNETTAARWARLKNQFEEFFIGNEAQSWLGSVIDGLRAVIDLLTGNGGWSQAIRAVTIAWGMFKLGLGEAFWKYIISNIIAVGKSIMTLGTTMTTVKTKWIASWKAMDAATKTNWIMAILAAVYLLGKAIWDAATKISELDKALNELDNETDDAVRHVGRLMTAFNDAGNKVNETTKKHEQLKNETEKLRKEVDELKKSTDKSTEAHDKLKKNEDELEKAEKELKKAEDESNKANNERSRLISEINSKYSTYLGYMLNEKTAAEQVASAHQLIIAALKEERKQKGLNAMHDAVDKEYAEDMKEYTEDSQSNLKDINRNAQRRVMDQWRRVMTAVSYDADNDRYTLSGVQGVTKGGTYRSEKELKAAMRSALREIIKTEAADKSGNVSVSTWVGKGIKSIDTYLNDIWGNSIDDGFGDWAETYIKRERDIMQATHDNQVETSQAHKETIEKAVADMNSNMKALVNTSQKNEKFTDDQIRQMAQNVNAIVASFEKYGSDMEHQEDSRKKIYGEGNEETLQNAVNNLLDNLDKNTRARVLRVAQQGRKSTTGTGNVDTNITSPWGSNPEAESTDWKNMSAEVLVNRRKQMKDFVNAIQTDTDVQSVLKEDAALKKAIEAGMSSDMRTVINWYNTERLKIQDELHARFLTNTGDWMDPKKQKAAHKQFKAELDAYLEELDAYYTERKTEIEKARSDEEITEGEAWRRNLKNENEWYQRRAELMMLYGEKAGDVTKEEQDRIVKIIAERTGDSEEFVRAMIQKTIGFAKQIEKSGEKGAAMVHDWFAKLDLKAQQSFLKSQQAITKQVKFIEDTLAKERPYDGITKNLQDNLDKMGVLAARMRKVNDELTAKGEQPKYSDADVTAQSYKEMAFYLRQAEDAYSIDITTLLKRMADEGMEETAKEIAESDMLKQAVMGQLRKTYQEVHDAIKKEASQIKKDVELLWNDETLGPDGKSIKANFDKVIAQLGMQQDSVSRANSLIGAGSASDNVASRIAMKQLQVQMDMQRAQFNMFRTQANQRMAALKAEAKEHERLAELAKLQGDAAEAERETLKKTTALRDADNVRRSLGLTLAEETKKEEEYQAELLKQREEIQARLYKDLREWADLLASSVQSLFEAEHAGDAEYYNERAKLDLTGKGGPGAGTYIVIGNEGTEDAKAHYEYLDERQALERQHEIEQENARAEAWKKVMDDLNAKMNDQITDWMNASLQRQTTEANTKAIDTNTAAIIANTEQMAKGIKVDQQSTPDITKSAVDIAKDATKDIKGSPRRKGTKIDPHDNSTWGYAARKREGLPAVDTNEPDSMPTPSMPQENSIVSGELERNTQALQELTRELGFSAGEEKAPKEKFTAPEYDENDPSTWGRAERKRAGYQVDEGDTPDEMPVDPMTAAQLQIDADNLVTDTKIENANRLADAEIDASNRKTDVKTSNDKKEEQSTTSKNKKEEQSTQSTFAKMTAAANLYGLAYQTMSNDNLSSSEKFQMFALQAAGQAAIGMLTTNLFQEEANNMVRMPGILGKLLGEMPYPAAIATYAAVTALMGGLMAMAVSKVGKAKSQIAQVTGSSASAGRLATGMLTYAEGNVNEFTDPASLTPGRSYNVDGADGKTYRAKYTGKNPRTHITNGPEFHLVGEAGREAIIDAHTTRLMQMDDTGIWQAIQTLYNGGSIRRRSTLRKGRGVAAFADGNLDDFEEISSEMGGGGGMDMTQLVSLQASIDRQSDLLEDLRTNGIKATFDVYGKGGLVDSYDTGKKNVTRHGERY